MLPKLLQEIYYEQLGKKVDSGRNMGIFLLFSAKFHSHSGKNMTFNNFPEKRMFLPPGEDDRCVSGKCGTKKSICCTSNLLRKSVLR